MSRRPVRRILLVGSSGGHLLQLLRLQPALGNLEKHWVCFDKTDARHFLEDEAVTWCHHPTTRNIPNLIRNTFQAIGVLRRFRPDVILSSGAAVAVPYFYLGRLMGARTVFVEAFNRVRSRSVTGRMVYPICNLFCVQWRSMRELYPRAEYIGRLP